MIHHFDHRWATYEPDGATRLVTAEEKADLNFVVMPRYWVAEQEVTAKLPSGTPNEDFLAGYRWIARSTDERTMIAATFPRSGAGNSLPVILSSGDPKVLTVLMSAFALDFAARQKLGGANMTFGTVSQLPIPSPSELNKVPEWSNRSLGHWANDQSRRITRQARSRRLLRAELDAAFFHLYGIERDDVDYIMDTFPIVKRKDEAQHGEYRTKRLILEAYDAMAEAEATGIPYRSSTGIDDAQLEATT